MRRKWPLSNKKGLETQSAHHNLDRATLYRHLEVHMSDRHFSHEVWLSKLGSPQEFVTSGILRGFPGFLKSDIFGIGHRHTLRFQ